jgi:hypothetical protein
VKLAKALLNDRGLPDGVSGGNIVPLAGATGINAGAKK